MSAPTADTEAALDFLSRMFDATVPRHLVAISETGKVAAQSFGPTVIERARAWYRSPEYAFALAVREEALSRNLVLVDGVGAAS